ncbi:MULTISPECIES: DUF883 family protein [Erwinia]|uniref:ElaB/YqjD/DUF883 family membrane-anchored ribosome-binding protein n=1 Tax=Erwinia rhapontici TaxID=55212 RepID=A0ABN6DN34_ERWRD|nr:MULTISPECIES: DUF883 family protein [Erwinia]MBP2157223.1 ElaB/YqjD/DUF883 family membrane-anchored ribosome-binding protein [Erwinia rhapontici]MCS3609052.1 ElaB/YqjD/DUF883 family membrane-anchored ribosome-binding protein [Erwinia rhapontici]NKG29307.1 DUF883 family protein [Erwinia rhapontici]NNS07062.1 DUF883 family protein [Erwinia sp. JH02]TDS97181.1 ElaB/YqjD/DUF883 family membrane-anchored ribosome-binding protein [Erwinia rhapontici]
MFNRTTKNNDIDLNQDVSLLADSLDDLLKSWGSKSKEEADEARSRAESLLKETRAKLHGRNRVTQAAKDAGNHVDNYIHDKPWHGVGIGTALGILVGALIATTTSSR